MICRLCEKSFEPTGRIRVCQVCLGKLYAELSRPVPERDYALRESRLREVSPEVAESHMRALAERYMRYRGRVRKRDARQGWTAERRKTA